jgi:hypothetical protein
MHISTHLNKVIILTDQEASYTVNITSRIGEALYSGEVCSKKQRIIIYGLESGVYAISVMGQDRSCKQTVTID